ncbi:MAG: M56 family metallopeptidase [Bdellovibrio sp.]
MTTLIFFNLFSNAVFSFWIGLLVVFFFIKLFRVRTGPWKLFLLLLPFIKVLYDFLSGVPTNSILVQHINPFKVQPGFQTINIGIGGSYWGPTLQLLFTVKDALKNQFAASAGDYLFFWIAGKHATIPAFAVLFALSVSAFLVGRRLFHAYRFESLRKEDRTFSFQLGTEKIDFRTVDVYISKGFAGTPFTGKIFKPYICIPEETYKNLKAEEIAAVLAHEIGHIRQFDIVFTMFIQFLGDFFWFVPGYRWLSRKIDCLREIVADQFAVKTGIRGEYLASALLTLKEIPKDENNFVLYSAFARERSLLKTRILFLLGETAEKSERFGWNFLLVRIILSIWITKAVVNSSLGGNYGTNFASPESLIKLLTDHFNN